MSNVMENFPALAPLIALAAGALVVLVLDLLLPARAARPWWFVAGAGALLLAGWYGASLWGRDAAAFGGAFRADRFALSFLFLVLAAALATLSLSLGRTEEDLSGYVAQLLWAAMGMAVLAGAGNLMTVFLGLEILSLALYVLIAFVAQDRAREAALKYFLLGSAAAGLLIFGFALIYGATGTLDLAALSRWAQAQQGPLPLYFKVGAGLALAGYAFKLALAPFHVWVPDVYEGAPTAVTAFMSVGTKAAAFAAAARFLTHVVPPASAAAVAVPLAALALLSMLVGSLPALRQQNLKRLLAYSGIAHAGYLLMALPGLPGGVGAGTFYLFGYLFANTGAFAVALYLDQQGEDGADVSTYTGLFYRRPALAVAMAAFLFALAGLPPTAGFLGKFYLSLAAARAGAWALLAALVVATGISGYAYLRVLGLMLQKAPAQRAVAVPAAGGAAPAAVPGATAAAGAVVAACLVGTLLLGVFPEPLLRLVQAALP